MTLNQQVADALKQLGYVPCTYKSRLYFENGNIRLTIPRMVGLVKSVLVTPGIRISDKAVEAELILLSTNARPAATSAQNTQSLEGMVNSALLAMNISEHPTAREFRLNDVKQDIESLAMNVFTHIQVTYQQSPSISMIVAALNNVFSAREQESAEQFIYNINYDPTAPNTFKDYVSLFIIPEEREIATIIFRHLVWNIKRVIRGESRYNPILVGLYGARNSGKSRIVSEWLKTLPMGFVLDEAHADKLFNNDEKQKAFATAWLIFLNEFSGMKDVDADMLKNKLDRDYVSYRMFHTQKWDTQKNIANLIGTTNFPMRDFLKSDIDIRKYCQLDVMTFVTQEDIVNKLITPIMAFDITSLFRCVDEYGPSPFHDNGAYDNYLRWTGGKCAHRTITIRFVIDLMLKDNGECESISAADLYTRYVRYHNEHNGNKDFTKPQSQIKFSHFLKKLGFEVCRESDGIKYTIPKRLAVDFEELEHLRIRNEIVV